MSRIGKSGIQWARLNLRMEKQPANGILEDFRMEFMDCWQRLPNKGLFLVLLVAWLALFHFLGNATLGYHLVNIFLHAMAALLLAAVLRRLEVPGAYLAAAIFALHPVCVESVAWITEIKNTLSAVFYLSAAMLYLRFDQSRKTPLYLGSLLLFVLSLLSKTVTATLPAALLVIFWWQRSRLDWRRDLVPLLPEFLARHTF